MSKRLVGGIIGCKYKKKLFVVAVTLLRRRYIGGDSEISIVHVYAAVQEGGRPQCTVTAYFTVPGNRSSIEYQYNIGFTSQCRTAAAAFSGVHYGPIFVRLYFPTSTTTFYIII